jgi:tRNA(Ile)-lysidine synthetase-like protein
MRQTPSPDDPLLRATLDSLNASLRPPRLILVAYSGGLDSTCLLHAARAASLLLDAQLVAAHVNHQLRPSASIDAAHCASWCAQQRIALRPLTLHIQPRGSTQAQARTQRYAALANLASELRADVLLTAHHLDDAIETALIHMLRGHGSRGLSSLARPITTTPYADWLPLHRPLLSLTRADLLDWATHRALRWIEDPTNAPESASGYTRNALRHHALPHLLHTTHDAHRGFAASLHALHQESDALEQLADSLLHEARRPWPEAGTLALHIPSLISSPPAILARALQRLMDQLDRAPLTAQHIDALTTWLSLPEHEATSRSLPGALAERLGPLMLLNACSGQGDRSLIAARTATPIPLDTPEGCVPWFGGQLAWRWPHAAPTASLELRGLRPGDRWEHNARPVSESLRAAGIPPRIRWRHPLIALKDAPLIRWAADVYPHPDEPSITWTPAQK